MDTHLPTAARSFGLIAPVACTRGRCTSQAPLYRRVPQRREPRVTMSVAAPKNSAQSTPAPTPYSDPHVEVCCAHAAVVKHSALQEIEKKAADVELSDEWRALQQHVSVIDNTYARSVTL